ncbi:MAG: hypothetical protein QW500_02035 [Candidatus Micrarchaeia archaeon]
MSSNQALKTPISKTKETAEIVHENSYNVLNSINATVNSTETERVLGAQSLKNLVNRYGKKDIINGLNRLKKSGKINEEEYNRLVEIANEIDYDRMYKNVVTTQSLKVGGKSEKVDAIKDTSVLLDKEIRDVVCFVYLVSIISIPEMKEVPHPEKKLYFTAHTQDTKNAEKIKKQIDDVQSIYNTLLSDKISEINYLAIRGKQAYLFLQGYPPLGLHIDFEPLYSIAGRLKPPEIGDVPLQSDPQVEYFGKEYKDRIKKIGNNYYVSGKWLYTTPEGREALKGYFSQGKWEIGGIKSTDKDASKKLFELVEKTAGTYGYEKTMAWLEEHYKQGKITNEQMQMIEPLVRVVDEIRKRIVSMAYESTKDIMMFYAGGEKRFELRPIGGSQASITVGGGAYYTAFEVYDEKNKAVVGTLYVRGELQWEKYSGLAVQFQVFNDFGLMQDNKSIVDASALAFGAELSEQVGNRLALKFGLGGQVALTAQNIYTSGGVTWYPKKNMLYIQEVGIGPKLSLTNIDVENILKNQGFTPEFAGAMGNVIPPYLWKAGIPVDITFGGKNWKLELSSEAGYMLLTNKDLKGIPEGGKFYWGGSAGVEINLYEDWVINLNISVYK